MCLIAVFLGCVAELALVGSTCAVCCGADVTDKRLLPKDGETVVDTIPFGVVKLLCLIAVFLGSVTELALVGNTITVCCEADATDGGLFPKDGELVVDCF